VMTSIEGLAFGAFIAWYDTSFLFLNEGISYRVAQYGAYSYSIYLLHFFIVFKASRFIHENVSDLTNPYFAYGWSAVFFLAMLPIAYASFRLIEKPFLALRKPYLRT
ncbi:MAG: acyltransferase, partial [Pseudomonadota bacterium]